MNAQELLLIFRRGQLDQFLEPDLSTLNSDRRKNPDDVVKYLSERYLVPVQGAVVKSQDWRAWSQDADPWREIAQSVRTQGVKLAPFRLGTAALIATRGFLHF